MKKLYVVALSIATIISSNVYSSDMHDIINESLRDLHEVLTRQDNTSLLTAGTSGVVSYFAGSYCMELAKTFDSTTEKKNGTKIGRSVARTIALVLKTAGYTGTIYGGVALASIPLRYFVAPIKATYNVI